MAFPITILDVIVEVALGADLTADPSDWVWTATPPAGQPGCIRAEGGVVITRGGRDGSIQSPPSTCTLTADGTDGRWVPSNPLGVWYGRLRKNTPIRIRTNETASSVRWTGFLSSLPPRWREGESDVVVTITASGILQRLQRGKTPLRSALVRAITAMEVDAVNVSPIAYWPGEDGGGATTLAEYAGGAPMTWVNDLTPASEGPGGSAPLPEFTSSSGVKGSLPHRTSTGEWSVAFVMNFPASPPAAVTLLRWKTSGTYPMWEIILTPGAPDVITLVARDAFDAIQINENMNFDIGGVEPFAEWVFVQADARQSGTSVIYSMTVHNATGGTSAAGSGPTTTTGIITSISVPASFKHDGMHAGHWAVWDAVLDSLIDPLALDGFTGEPVRDRAVRLGNEEGIGVETDSLPDITMGPQGQQTFLTLLREAEAVGGGRLYENLDPTTFNAPLRLKFAEDFTNVDATLVLDHDSGYLFEPFEPTDDDTYIRNDWTAIRSGATGIGSSAHVVATEGEYGSLTPANVGTYDDSVSVNVELDEQLPHQAGWRVAVGTVEGLRYSTVTLNLAAKPSLIPAWLDCDIGSRITITNPPAGLPPDPIDLLIEGWTETLDAFTWSVQLFCSPYAPYRVFELAQDAGDVDPYLGRLAGDEKAALRNALTSTATGSVNFDPNFGKWTEVADDFPLDIRMGGEVVTLSGISTSAASFLAVGAASHADNAAVTPVLYAGANVRQLILVFAAIRSSGAGTLATPAGYTRLPVFGPTDNVQLFGKVHTGTESDPTITPSGGAAGDTVSAFTFGWSATPSTLADLSDIVLDAIPQLNASAQNIGYGGLYAWQWTGNVNLLLAWKQDDYTSVAPPAGWTEILEGSTVTGNDQSLYAAYRIDTTPVVTNEGSLVVTGGAAAISRSAVVALAAGIQIMTISARSVNGVTKAHSAGALIAVDDPAVLGL